MRKTSLAAFEKIRTSGMLKTRRGQAYACLYEHGPMTAMEATHQVGINGLWKRFSELRTLGLADEFGERDCKISGMPASVWDVTDKIYDPADLAKLKPVHLWVIKKKGKVGRAYTSEEQARGEWSAKDGDLLKVTVKDVFEHPDS